MSIHKPFNALNSKKLIYSPKLLVPFRKANFSLWIRAGEHDFVRPRIRIAFFFIFTCISSSVINSYTNFSLFLFGWRHSSSKSSWGFPNSPISWAVWVSRVSSIHRSTPQISSIGLHSSVISIHLLYTYNVQQHISERNK